MLGYKYQTRVVFDQPEPLSLGVNTQQLMYRYSIDNVVTYSSEDVTLFKESPFASWMERLSLENPDHGIAPDSDSSAVPVRSQQYTRSAAHGKRSDIEPIGWEEVVLTRQAPHGVKIEKREELVESLTARGKVVVLIDQMKDELLRRTETLEAMRTGADLIVNGQLASGPLSETADLLMRTGGNSDLGSYLYIPCDTSPKTTPHSAFRLCFLADILHSLQGQLPPQMLIIRADSDMVSLPTEGHIYYYRGVKQRFMTAQHAFRKHRMPDPAASSHFGRWSKCANDVLKQRALREGSDADEDADLNLEEEGLQAAVPQAAVGDRDYPQAAAVSELAPWTQPAPLVNLRSPGTSSYTDSAPRTHQSGVEGGLLGRARQYRPRAGKKSATGFIPAHPPAEREFSERALRQPMIDRDCTTYLSPETQSLPTQQMQSVSPKADACPAEQSNKPTRPFSSVLITCMDSDY